MCLGIPGKIVERDPPAEASDLPMGTVDFGGVRKRICLCYVPEAKVDDYVLVHVGFALSIVDPEEAQRIFEALDEMEEIAAELGAGATPHDPGAGGAADTQEDADS